MVQAPAATEPVLRAVGLVKRYGDLEAVRGISITLQRGECLALLGPNGAGKTTTVEMLNGLTKPTAGEVSILGRPLATEKRAIMERVGVVLQETNLYKRFTVEETLRLFASFYKRETVTRGGRNSVASIMERLGLTDKRKAQLRTLSGGQRQRVALGAALVNDPALLFLDEPTTGLDPAARRAIWDLVAELTREGRSVLLTTHYMEEAEVLAHRVAVVDQGKIIAEGAPRQLIREVTGASVVRARLPASVLPRRDALARTVSAAAGAKAVVRSWDHGLELTTEDGAGSVATLIATLKSDHVDVEELEMRHGTLEDVFLKLTGRSMRDA
jgi:ABC-2 type transport system ATP-binding protein